MMFRKVKAVMTSNRDIESGIDSWLEAAKEIAFEAGEIISKIAATGPVVTHKGPVDLVTDADIKSENFMVAELKRRFPDHSILAEEGGGDGNTRFCWLIDPIDGTTNYAHGFPVYAVSIGLLVDNMPVVGVVFDPNLDEMFTASLGRGAVLNDRRIQVSGIDSLDKALLATGFPYTLRENYKTIMSNFTNVSLACQGVRRAGAASLDLCSLACGRFDGFWEVGLKPWDTAAAGLVVQEAGGSLSKYNGSAFDHFVPEMVASNNKIHDQLLKLLQENDD